MPQKLKELVQDAVVGQTTDIINAANADDAKQVAVNVAEKTAAFAIRDDKFSYRAVIIILGLALIVVAVTYSIHSLTSTEAKFPDLPDALIALGSAAIGALAGLLAPSPRQ